MLSRKDVEEGRKADQEASAMLHESLALNAARATQLKPFEDRDEEQSGDPYGCDGSFGRWLEAEAKAKLLAARKKVEPLVDPKGKKTGLRVPFETILGTIQHGVWRSPDELAKAYGRPRVWAMQFRAVAIAQGFITKDEWRAAFRSIQGFE